MEVEWDDTIADLALRIDESALQGRSDDLARLDMECRDLLGKPDHSDALLQYFRANIQSALQDAEVLGSWAWRQPHRERQILYIRRARTDPSFDRLSPVRRAQIVTNLANEMSTLGRPVEALRLYKAVLRDRPAFAMAIANRGIVRATFARMVHDDGHRALLVAHACCDFERVRSGDVEWEADYPDMIEAVGREAAQLRGAVDVDAVLARIDLDDWPLGDGEERAYRTRMLDMGLFLNPLAVLGPHAIAAADPLHLPSHSYGIDNPPHFLSWYNQLKQEFVAARLLYHEAMEGAPFEDRETHFADRENRLVDTLDYPVFSVAAEKMRLSFRTAYGLLDKIAGFLNVYFRLGHDAKRVDFRGVWYSDPRTRQTLHPTLADRPNLALRGLYWLSFDILGVQGTEDDAIAPDAAYLNTLRNVLEHRCLVLTDRWQDETDSVIEKERSITFRCHTVRMLEMAHEALILLSLAMHGEERRHDRSNATLVVDMHLPDYEHR